MITPVVIEIENSRRTILDEFLSLYSKKYHVAHEYNIGPKERLLIKYN